MLLVQVREVCEDLVRTVVLRRGGLQAAWPTTCPLGLQAARKALQGHPTCNSSSSGNQGRFPWWKPQQQQLLHGEAALSQELRTAASPTEATVRACPPWALTPRARWRGALPG